MLTIDSISFSAKDGMALKKKTFMSITLYYYLSKSGNYQKRNWSSIFFEGSSKWTQNV